MAEVVSTEAIERQLAEVQAAVEKATAERDRLRREQAWRTKNRDAISTETVALMRAHYTQRGDAGGLQWLDGLVLQATERVRAKHAAQVGPAREARRVA